MDTTQEVLVVEDHAVLRAAMALALRRDGFIVRTAGSVPAALAALAAQPSIAVALLEVILGPDGLDGFAFAALATALRSDFGIIFLTGRADLLLGRDQGPREVHLLKPCPMARIGDAIRRMLQDSTPGSA